MKLGIAEHIDCAHHLPGHPKCGQPHGHTYKVELILEGEPKDGMIIDFAEAKARLRDVLRRYDHQDLNQFLERPTVENLCLTLHAALEKVLAQRLVVRVWEGDGKWVEV